MADYAGAVAAARTLFVTAWSTTTPVAFQNETPQNGSGAAIKPWPPVGTDKAPVPWVYFEMIATSSTQRGAGKRGSQVWLTVGYIYVHVLAPKGYGLPASLALADQAGEIFRAQTFYQDGAGAKVICGAPQVDGGASDADDGNQFRVTMAVKFEFYFLK
jgi:hypothetical protein